jgi:glycosyltransferase involved in cell wall biosynthesis
VAAELAAAFGRVAGTEAVLSLSRQAEILAGRTPPRCDLPIDTYEGVAGLIGRLAQAPFRVGSLARRIRALRVDVAICAMPGPLDGLMAWALRRCGVPFLVMVHDADLHPGDGFPLQMRFQRALMRRAAGLIALTRHVADRLRAQGVVGDRPLLLAALPPMGFGPPPPPPRAHGGALRLLCFGRLLPYKGLDLLADALALLGGRDDLVVRVVGQGPESPVLDALRALAGVTVENRWVPEDEVGAILAWADAIVLPYREASQSGVAAAAVAAGRWVVATRVGGIAEQLDGEGVARLCEPETAALASAIGSLLTRAPCSRAAPDPAAAWRELAVDLLRRMPR